jgi:hypothetical protein
MKFTNSTGWQTRHRQKRRVERWGFARNSLVWFSRAALIFPELYAAINYGPPHDQDNIDGGEQYAAAA